jgi:hypothetical protein
MFGLIELPNDQEESLCMLFFTKEEEANNYIKLFQEKHPGDQTKFKIVKIKKHMVFDAGADEEDCYYPFDPKLEQVNDNEDEKEN